MRAAVVLLLVLTSACSGIRSTTRTGAIAVETTPPGAVVTMTNERGKQSLGASPASVEVEYVEEHIDFNPWSVLVPLISCGGTAGLIVLAAETDNLATAFSISGAIIAGLTCLGSTGNVISSAAGDGDLVRTYYKDGAPTFAAELQGHSNASLALTDGEPLPTDPLRFELHATGMMLGGLIGKAIPAPDPTRSIVAVFEVTTADKAFAPATLDQLTEYLSTRIAETKRYRVVPRDQLRRHLADQKKDSYRECVDESCQIELGKAVAAQLSLATKLLHVGTSCTLSATMYDLETEATSSGASVRTTCEPDKLMDGIEELVTKLTRE